MNQKKIFFSLAATVMMVSAGETLAAGVEAIIPADATRHAVDYTRTNRPPVESRLFRSTAPLNADSIIISV